MEGRTMLCLSRKIGEYVVVGEQLQVRVLAVTGDTVRLGFDGPRDVPVRRSELPPKKQEGLN
jgi:carbon storage regulator